MSRDKSSKASHCATVDWAVILEECYCKLKRVKAIEITIALPLQTWEETMEEEAEEPQEVVEVAEVHPEEPQQLKQAERDCQQQHQS